MTTGYDTTGGGFSSFNGCSGVNTGGSNNNGNGLINPNFIHQNFDNQNSFFENPSTNFETGGGPTFSDDFLSPADFNLDSKSGGQNQQTNHHQHPQNGLFRQPNSCYNYGQNSHTDIMDSSPSEVCETAALISDDELANLNIKDLNRKLKEKGLSKVEMEKVKQRRRTLKNRKYATDCREKKDVEVHQLEGDKTGEEAEVQAIHEENEQLRASLDQLKKRYAEFVDYAKKNNIPLRQRNVPLNMTSSTSSSDTAEQ